MLAAMRRDYLATIAAQQRFGDVVRLQILNERTVDVFDPELLHRDPRWWPHQPDAFWPERFFPESDARTPYPIPRGAYLPFGLGPRVCLGQHFAQLEMSLIAAPLLQRFVLKTLSDTPAHTAAGRDPAAARRPASATGGPCMNNPWLMAAAGLSVLIALAHTVLGEFRIFRHLRRAGHLVPTEGGAVLRDFQVRILWGAWHGLSAMVMAGQIAVHAVAVSDPGWV